jgi:hypothetical protein
MSVVNKLIIFFTISIMMIAISSIFRNVQDGKLQNRNNLNYSVKLILSILITGLVIIMISNP